MKHKRNLVLILLVSIGLAILGFFKDGDLVVADTTTKIMEIVMVSFLLFLFFAVLYLLLQFVKSGAKKVTTKKVTNKKKKDLTE